MEESHTATHYWVWALWPPIPVPPAALSMEVAPGLVGVMECGVGQIQCVSVSGHCVNVVFF